MEVGRIQPRKHLRIQPDSHSWFSVECRAAIMLTIDCTHLKELNVGGGGSMQPAMRMSGHLVQLD